MEAAKAGPMSQRKWQIVSSEYVLDSPWYRIRRDVCRLPDGTVVDSYYVREHLGFAIIFALTPEGMVVFNRQYKHGIGESVLELPAGALEAGESPAACAKRELEEETGYVADALEPVTQFITDPTSSNGQIYLFFARDVKPAGVPAREVTEDIDVVLVPLDQVLDQVRSGAVNVQSHVAAIYFMLDRLGKIRT